MKKLWPYFRNKYILTISIFVIYGLFLDDVDIFSIVRQNRKLKELNDASIDVDQKLTATRSTLKKLEHESEIERYAREKKLFKKDDEDVFVISYE